MTSIKLLLLTLCALLITSMIGYKHYYLINRLYFVIEIQTSSKIGGVSQVYFDTGHNYNEQNSARLQIQPNVFKKYSFPLPASLAIESIRFDPIIFSSVLSIKNAGIENGVGDSLKNFSVQAFKAIHQIDRMEIDKDVLVIHTAENANDPITEIKNSSFDGKKISWIDFLVQRGWLYAGYFLLSFTILVVLTDLVKRRQQIVELLKRLFDYTIANSRSIAFLVSVARCYINKIPILSKDQINKPWIILGSLATTITLVFFLCLFFNPRWHTNDDVAMSMIAHGYGLAAIGSPNLVFSNVLWGYIVRAIPEINGLLGYSIATLSVLVIVGTIVIYGLFRIGVGYMACLSILVLILVRPIIFPQFTINAGLLLIGTVICWHLYARQNNWQLLIAGSLLAFFSYLVRWEEFFLIFFIALPLLPWRTLLLQRLSQVVLLALISAIAISTVINQQAYTGDEWTDFNEFRPAVSPFVNYGAVNHLIQRPDILEQHGYTVNDVSLLGQFFFADKNIGNVNALKSMVAELGVLPEKTGMLANGWIGVQTLWHPALLPLILTAIFLFLCHPSWKVAASWVLCIAAFFVLGVLGRPGTLRVCLPLASFLVLAPFLVANFTTWRKHFETSVLLMACLINMSLVFSESKEFQMTTDKTLKSLAGFPNESVVIWGAALPFESIYPVLGASSAAMHYQLYSLASFTLAPFSVSYTEDKIGQGMIKRLLSEKGVPIVAVSLQFDTLKTYCKERFYGQLKELSSKQYGDIVVSQRRCEVMP